MRNLILTAALLASSAAQAGYYNQLGDGPTPEQLQMYRQQQMLYEQQREIEDMRRHMPECRTFLTRDGQQVSRCD